MRLTSSRAYYRPSPPKMPPGLVELMEGLTKEVLKRNPSDIYGFCAGHMQQLLDKRDGPSPKKALPLEEKITRAQGKVRQRAENRRKEYDKNVVVQQQNNNVTSLNDIKTNLKLEDSSIVFDKDNDEVAQNNDNTQIRQDQVLKYSNEMEIANESRWTVSKQTEDVDDNKDNKQNFVNVQEVETVHPQISEEGQSATGTESNQQNGSTIVNDISSNMKPDIETVNKNLIDKNILLLYDTSKLLNVTNQINENQDENLIKHEGQSEIYHQKLEPAETESKKSLYVCGVDNIPNENSKGENITDSKDSKQPVDIPVGIEKNLSESFNAKQVNIDNFNDNEKVTIKDTQLPTDLIDMYFSTSPHHTDDNVRQHQHTKDVQLSTPVDDVQKLNDATDSFTHSDVLRTDHHDDVEVDNVDDPPKNNSKILRELIEKDIIGKCDDVKGLNNTTNSDEIHDQHKQIANIFVGVNNTIEKMQTPQMGLLETGVDSDIQTLVTENSVNDTYEINDVGGTLQLKRITSFDDMDQENEKNSNLEQTSAENVCDHTKHCDNVTVSPKKVADVMRDNESKNDDTSQDKTSTKIYENNQNENQGTNMDLETAAITIQKVFRNFLFKSRGSTFEDTANDEGNFMDEDNKNKEECNFSMTNSLSTDRRAHGITRMDTVLQTVNEEKSLSLSTDDSSTLSSAATIIQAHVRGFLARNKLNSNKTVSSTSVAASNSNEPSYTSIEAGSDQSKNKNVLNIHIVPEGENYLSRDESLITSMDLSLDSPPSSINLHPLGYDKSERRKLKREDAIQSISPPSNNSGKLSEDLDSVKELPASAHDLASHLVDDINKENNKSIPIEKALTATDTKINETIETSDYKTLHPQRFSSKKESLTKINFDETDVVTPFVSNEDLTSLKLTHSGEFHDAVLPTRVSRSDTSVVSEFKNVLVYFLLWNHS
ncbi:unnamed protein product [Arctia plantaginis]|uniref:RIIa domain-containing protein n=1 Tax=Arctia plantaginis TaxID=874455 RepID=A0A8S1ARS8_ARCPL|nr:unnamed protein product [Arctia plantaginis]